MVRLGISLPSQSAFWHQCQNELAVYAVFVTIEPFIQKFGSTTINGKEKQLEFIGLIDALGTVAGNVETDDVAITSLIRNTSNDSVNVVNNTPQGTLMNQLTIIIT